MLIRYGSLSSTFSCLVTRLYILRNHCMKIVNKAFGSVGKFKYLGKVAF
jgi:hypothetical protein